MVIGLTPATPAPGLGLAMPYLRRDLGSLCHICAGTWAHPCHTHRDLGSPATGTWAHLPHLRRNWAHPCHICAATRRPCHIRTGTGPALPTSALGPLHEELDAPSALPPAASYDMTNGDAQLASYLAPTTAAGGCAQSDTDTLVWMSERSGYSPFATSRRDSLRIVVQFATSCLDSL